RCDAELPACAATASSVIPRPCRKRRIAGPIRCRCTGCLSTTVLLPICHAAAPRTPGGTRPTGCNRHTDLGQDLPPLCFRPSTGQASDGILDAAEILTARPASRPPTRPAPSTSLPLTGSKLF